MTGDPTRRFSTRVEDYIKYRPSYPPAIIALLAERCGLEPESVVADIGSGTGILSELFLKNGNVVYGVEPNREMREAGERLMAAYENFRSIDGRAEASTLDDASVDFVTAGQAFHWFDSAATRVEFERILKPGGWVVVVWNDRLTAGTQFLEDYENLLLTYGTDYREVSDKYDEERLLRPFFETREFRRTTFKNTQTFDYEGLEGRLRSASYTPEPGHPNFRPMMDELQRVFDEHQVNGGVSVTYDTKVFYGELDPQ